jgi:4-carboxymuconolactone decarboxylase
MPPNSRAQKNHDELFPGHVSTLAVTDPELIEIFDNFAFDEVLSHGNLDKRTRLMVQLAAIIASRAAGEYRVILGAALAAGVTPTGECEVVDLGCGWIDFYTFTGSSPRSSTPAESG